MEPKPEYQLHERKEIYRGRIVNLMVDSITTGNGVATIREVFQHPGGAAVVPLLPDGTVLLVKQFRYPMGEYLLELPAGKIDNQEPPEETAARELAEEVGFQAGSMKKIAEFYSTPGFCDEILHIYLAADLTPVESHQDDDEEIEIVRLSLPELKKLMEAGQIRDGKTLIGIQYLLLLQKRGEL
jgi:ADP-ribose pyrophosphatase